jgi:hypothetical protein
MGTWMPDNRGVTTYVLPKGDPEKLSKTIKIR